MLQDSATPKMVRNVIDGTTPPQKVVGSYEQLEDGTYNLVIGVTGDAPSAAAISQINGEDLAGKEFYDYVRTEGAVLFSFNPDFSPAARYGGSWEQITDRFLIGAGGSYALGSTGGEATHAHGLSDGYACIYLAADRINCRVKDNTNWWTAKVTTQDGLIKTSDVNWGFQSASALGGSTEKAQTLPPYIAVNIWRRVA